ncbi:MAG TPA: plastocyanin/azurin family copper-binding protein [Candidatus Saccharimonadales bacterium]|jgi:plastocyanin|nr:plastocyanin/azurin family copper-binding protein [Candidatus Saccharimonadales bacterium]
MASPRTAFALIATVAIAAACSSPAAAPAATSAPAAAASVNIDVQGFKFPPNTDVAPGTKVTWTNKDSVGHTVTSGTRPNKDGKFDGTLGASGTFSFTFTTAGTYQYFCTVHSSMNGTITVK